MKLLDNSLKRSDVYKINDQELLERYALEAEWSYLRDAAVDAIKEQERLANIATESKRPEIRAKAGTKIEDQDLFITVENQVIRLSGNPTEETWIYDFSMNKWESKAAAPFSFHLATHFELANNYYITTTEGEFWRYDPINHEFEQLENVNGLIADFSYSFVLLN